MSYYVDYRQCNMSFKQNVLDSEILEHCNKACNTRFASVENLLLALSLNSNFQPVDYLHYGEMEKALFYAIAPFIEPDSFVGFEEESGLIFGFAYDGDTTKEIGGDIAYKGREISSMSAEEICNSLSDSQKDALYRLLWKEYVKEDVESRLEDLGVQISDEDIDEISNRYVYDGDYDCNNSYWDNIDSLINEISYGKEDKEL